MNPVGVENMLSIVTMMTTEQNGSTRLTGNSEQSEIWCPLTVLFNLAMTKTLHLKMYSAESEQLYDI